MCNPTGKAHFQCKCPRPRTHAPTHLPRSCSNRKRNTKPTEQTQNSTPGQCLLDLPAR
jgi:hypothetical protein